MRTIKDLQPMAPRFRLDGKAALVTGSGRGIGSGIALALAEAGAEVVLLSRTRSELDAVASEIVGRGYRQPQVLVCDVTDTAALRQAIGSLSRLDILVNNAATNIPRPFLEVSDEEFAVMSDLNVRAYFVAAQAGVRKMLEDPERKSKGGVVINITSQMGHIGSPNRVPYCMTKHAEEGMTKAMAIELVDQGIRVNSIGPTFTVTPLIEKIVNTPEVRQFLVSRIPMGHMAAIEDMAAAALYLASPAAAMVTGSSLLVDGGWTAQ